MLASDKLAKLDEMTIRSVSRQGVTPEPLEQNFLATGGSTSFDTSHVTMIVSATQQTDKALECESSSSGGNLNAHLMMLNKTVGCEWSCCVSPDELAEWLFM